MCPPKTPDRSGAKNVTAAAASDKRKVTENTRTNGAFFKSSTYLKLDATNSMNCSSCAFSVTTKGNSQRVKLTIPSMILILLTCSAFSFFIGGYIRHSRHYYEETMFTSSNDGTVTITGASIPNFLSNEVLEDAVPTTWTYAVQSYKRKNDAQYSFKNFVGTQLASTVVSSNSVLLQPDGTFSYIAQEHTLMDKKETNFSAHDTTKDDSNNYEPSGQHILIDIENVDSSFLRSEERLTGAMTELILTRTNMTLLSYHCHSSVLQGIMGGISCAGILLESHVSFHTFPIFGIISFDLFSCGKSSLISVLPDIKELFAIPKPTISLSNELGNLSDDVYAVNDNVFRRNDTIGKTELKSSSEPQKQPRVTWTYKRRGFTSNEDVHSSGTKSASVADELPDLHWMLSMRNLDKTHVKTVQTEFQRIDIFDIKKFHTRPTEEIDRVVYLDGIIQSRFIGEQAYHEALVHPVMICHDSPKRVIIIGGGEGATLREVLKHKTVEEVIMVEIDEVMVLTSQKYLPEWSTCNNGISCFDDPRATTYFTDAIAWFIHRFGENSTVYDESDVFDIIIMDALDPDSIIEFSDFLYKNPDLMLAFSRALGESGIFVAQVGEDENMDDLPASFNPNNPLLVFLDGLETFGFESIIEYSESHGRFIESWGFIVAMKDRDSRSNWLRNEAEINLEIMKRITPTTPLAFFDGATMMNYQFASRITQEIWCRDKINGECSTGQGFDPFVSSMSHTLFTVQPSTVNKGGRGVFATQFVPKDTVIGIEECVNGMFLPSTTYQLLRDIAHEIDEHDKYVSNFWNVVFFGYVDGYGWIDSVYGLPSGGVDPGKMTFVNHGCNGTYNVGTPLDINEMTAPLGVGPGDAYDDINEVYNPYNDRRFPLWECEKFVALRDIEQGEELFDNYLVFGGGNDVDDWDKNLLELKSVCMGKSGTIAEYEAAALSGKHNMV